MTGEVTVWADVAGSAGAELMVVPVSAGGSGGPFWGCPALDDGASVVVGVSAEVVVSAEDGGPSIGPAARPWSVLLVVGSGCPDDAVVVGLPEVVPDVFAVDVVELCAPVVRPGLCDDTCAAPEPGGWATVGAEPGVAACAGDDPRSSVWAL